MKILLKIRLITEKHNIYLIGMPSSGKSTLGKKLAQLIDYQFFETDEYIVNQEQKSIADIFAQHGEAYFRQLEKKVLESIHPNQKLLISTGGGMPCFFDNINTMLTGGLVIYIDVSPQELSQRILLSTRNDRPLIQLENKDQLLIDLQKKYEERQQYYRQAHIVINHDFTANHLQNAMAFYTSS